jgi:hypothetical protein
LLGAIERELRHVACALKLARSPCSGPSNSCTSGVPGLHAGAGGEHDLGDAAVDVGGDVDLMHGGEIADRGQQVRNGFGLRRRQLTLAGGGLLLAKNCAIILPRNS